MKFQRWNGSEFMVGSTLRRWTGTEWDPPLIQADSDALAFLTAAGISDSSISSAVSTLVSDLKTAAVWDKLLALYPLVGGTEYSHKFNLIDPRDDDTAFRLTFHGGWSHTSFGIQGDGSTNWSDTHLSPRRDLSASSGSLGIYARSEGNGQGQPYDLACDDGDTHPVLVIAKYNNGNYFCGYGDDSFGPSGGSAAAPGFWAVNRLGVVSTQAVKNGAIINSANYTPVLPDAARTLYLGANNRAGSPAYYSNKQYGLAFAGQGLTPTELYDFYVAVQTFQTTLGRAI